MNNERGACATEINDLYQSDLGKIITDERKYCDLDTLFYRNTKLPFVLVLGNETAGKASFIDYVLDR